MSDIAVQQWRAVPDRVAELLPQAILAGIRYSKFAAETGDLLDSVATWQPDSGAIIIYRESLPAGAQEKAGEFLVRSRADFSGVNIASEIGIKSAGIPYVSQGFDLTQRALGGPTPLTNALVSGLALGGLGYGAGTVAENLFPEKYLERGKLRKTLGLAGAGVGLGLGGFNAYANSRRLYPGQGLLGFLKGFVTRNDTKIAQFMGAPGSSGATLFEPSLSVPNFNAITWQDVGRQNPLSTPPMYAAAATGLMSGIATAQRSPIIRPIDVISGIASAGVGLATANLAGRALSAMAGLTPAGQEKLQQMGMWGGMMHAIVPSIFGRR